MNKGEDNIDFDADVVNNIVERLHVESENEEESDNNRSLHEDKKTPRTSKKKLTMEMICNL